MKAKKRNRPPGCGDTTLMDLWRKAVRRKWGGRCVLHSSEGCIGELECHHMIPRARPHLKYYRDNGTLVCAFHHSKAAYRVYRTAIESRVGHETMATLSAREMELYPEFLRRVGMTKAEYLQEAKRELLAYLEQKED